MEHPTIVLGVEMMDQDHLRIEEMFEAASRAPDEDLPVLYRDIAKELAAHFSREEDFLRERQFPGLNCHLAQHNVLLAEMAHGEPPKAASGELRRRMLFVMPQLVLSHVTTMDRMAAAFLKGELEPAVRRVVDRQRLRLRPRLEAARLLLGFCSSRSSSCRVCLKTRRRAASRCLMRSNAVSRRRRACLRCSSACQAST